MNETGTPAQRSVKLSELPALVAYHGEAVWLEHRDAPTQRVSHGTAGLSARAKAPLLVHAPSTARRLRVERFFAFDLLELYAFVRPASFALPTPKGLAEVLGLVVPPHHDPVAEAKLLHHLTSGEMVKFEDGKEEEHKIIKTKDKAEIKNLTDWILSLGK